MENKTQRADCYCTLRVRLIFLLASCLGVVLIVLNFDERGLTILENLYAVRPVPVTQNNTSCITKSTSLRETAETPKMSRVSDRPCTFALLRQYQNDYHYFPGEGRWNLNSSQPHYQPSMCKFKYPRIGKDKVAACLRKAKISSVMTIGDSNGLRNFAALSGYATGCKNVRSEGLTSGGFVPLLNYYKRKKPVGNRQEWSQYLKAHYRHCGGCSGKQAVCTFQKHTVKFEHLVMTLVIDDQLRLEFGSYGEAAQAINNVWALTTQEVYFRYFLKDRYPDMFLVFLPFNHMHHMSHDRLQVDIEYFHSLVRTYFPSSSKIFFVPAFGEFLPRKPGMTLRERHEGSVGMCDVIDGFNHDMYRVVERYLQNALSNTFGFFDMVNMSRPVGAKWAADSKHMGGGWYHAAMSMFWETFCNSVDLGEL